MKLSPVDLRESISGKPDEHLYDMLFGRSQDYTPEALDAAREEFNRRQLDTPTIRNLADAAEKVRKMQEAHLSWALRSLAFFVSTAGLFIPVLLAHRHYVEKGERSKAREWARWAVYGFIFYCVLILLSRVLISL